MMRPTTRDFNLGMVLSSAGIRHSHNAGSLSELIHLLGVTSLNPTDYAFV